MLEHVAIHGGDSVGEVRHGKLPKDFPRKNGTPGKLEPNGYPKNASDAEATLIQYVKNLDSSAEVTPQTYVRATGFVRGRYVDACTNCLDEAGDVRLVDGTMMREAKSGGAGRRLGSRLKKQIDKDAAILARSPGAKVEWHFLASNYGLEVGIDVLDYLKLKNIKYVIHLPA